VTALRDVSERTKRINQLATELHAELTEGGIDFRKMVTLADEISENADRLASGFSTMADALEESLQQRDGPKERGEPAHASSQSSNDSG
jgi:uncharacterized coiled-coil DUF342 family protein